MGELAAEIELQISVEEEKTQNPDDQTNDGSSSRRRDYKWWVLMAVYTFFVLAGQSVATILGTLYYHKGGASKWIATLVQPGGFPVLLPLYYLSSCKKRSPETSDVINGGRNPENSPPIWVFLAMYGFLGVILAADCLLYSLGLLYLPVSTYSLICASQLAFNALFSYFLNAQKFTFLILNSLFLLTVSSALLVFQPDSSSGSQSVPKGKYAVGFICTVAASAGYGLMLSLTQFCFQRVLKKENFKVVLDMIVYQSLVATAVITVGLFASGDWKRLGEEMDGFESGKAAYVNNLVWTAVAWQAFNIGAVGLIFEISALFSNVISTLAIPIIPVLAIFIFRDPLTGIEVISMVLALWGFVSYVFQHYLDDCNSKAAKNS